MRFFISIALVYAGLSLFASTWMPVMLVEGTGLLFYRPWDRLRTLWTDENETTTEQAPAWRVQHRSFADPRWWQPVFAAGDRLPGFSLFAIRRIDRLPLKRGVLYYDLEPDLPVRTGDPVILGNALVGFVYSAAPGTPLGIKLLQDDADCAVLGEVSGTVAGTSVRFIAGGPSLEMEDLARIRVPSNRFGLAEGGTAYTAYDSMTPAVPAGLLLGRVRLGKAGPGELRDKVALQPAVPRERLNRLAVLVPTTRLGDPPLRDQTWVFPPPLEAIPVTITRTLKPWGCAADFRIDAGLECGLSPGDLIVSDLGALARLDRVGLFASSASILVRPGQEVELIVAHAEHGVIGFTASVEELCAGNYSVTSPDKPAGLEKGLAVYLAKEACSGLERYPAFFVMDAGEGDRFTLALPAAAASQEGCCLHFARTAEGAHVSPAQNSGPGAPEEGVILGS